MIFSINASATGPCPWPSEMGPTSLPIAWPLPARTPSGHSPGASTNTRGCTQLDSS